MELYKQFPIIAMVEFPTDTSFFKILLSDKIQKNYSS